MKEREREVEEIKRHRERKTAIKSVTERKRKEDMKKKLSGCCSVGRAVASDT